MKVFLSILITLSPLVATAQVKPHSDTIKIDIPKDNNFNPSSSKLRNSIIKTPVYNNNLTGTNAPGDVNTGIPEGNSNHYETKNVTLEKIKDSIAPRK